MNKGGPMLLFVKNFKEPNTYVLVTPPPLFEERRMK